MSKDLEDYLNIPLIYDKEKIEGEFIRGYVGLQKWVSMNENDEFPVEKNRYHLFVSLACPWCHKNVILRKIKNLEHIIGMTVVNPIREFRGRGWVYKDGPSLTEDSVDGLHNLKDLYLSSDPNYKGRPTVPVLYDTKTKRIVSNNDDDLQVMFSDIFPTLNTPKIEEKEKEIKIILFPKEHEKEIKEMNSFLYETINNGVYKCGFATSQKAYEKAFRKLFLALEWLENSRLSKTRFLFGNGVIVDSDLKLFGTLIRFDAVYYVLFKCNKRLISQSKNLYGYLRDIYQFMGIHETVNFDHIKKHYYFTLKDINPYSIIPLGPENIEESLKSEHHRESQFLK